MEKDQQEELQKAGRRILAVFAFVIVIALGVFGSLALASAVPNVFSGIASAIFSSEETPDDGNGQEGTVNETITLSAPSVAVNEDTPFIISWNHDGKTTEGLYTIRYDCTDTVSFTSPTGSGAQAELECNTPLNVGNTTSASFTPVSDEGTGEIEVPFRVEFTPNGESASTVSGAQTITVNRTADTTAGGGTGSAGGGTVTVPIPGSGIGVSDPNGFVDLSVSLVAVGVVNRSTNQFFPVAVPSRSSVNERIGIRFEVKNNGTRTSPTWRFTASLPTAQNYVYNSQTQSALRPGESIVYTLAFDTFINTTSGTVTVNVDPSNIIAESNEVNNRLIRVIQTNP